MIHDLMHPYPYRQSRECDARANDLRTLSEYDARNAKLEKEVSEIKKERDRAVERLCVFEPVRVLICVINVCVYMFVQCARVW